MDKSEIIERLKNIAGHAVHTVGERPFIMSLDDGIAVHEAIKLLTNYPEFPDSCNAETVEAIPVDWIESYALLAEADGRPFFAEGIRDMVEEWKRDRKVD